MGIENVTFLSTCLLFHPSFLLPVFPSSFPSSFTWFDVLFRSGGKAGAKTSREGKRAGLKGEGKERGCEGLRPCVEALPSCVCVCVWDQYWVAREIDQAYTASSQPPPLPLLRLYPSPALSSFPRHLPSIPTSAARAIVGNVAPRSRPLPFNFTFFAFL